MLDRHLTGDPAVLASSSPILDLLHASSLHLLALGLAVLDAIGLIGTRLLAVRGADLLALGVVGPRLLALRPHLLTVGPLRARLLPFGTHLLPLGALRASLLTFDARLLALSPLWALLRNLLRSSRRFALNSRRLGAYCAAAAALHLGSRTILGAAVAAGTRDRRDRNGQRGDTCG